MFTLNTVRSNDCVFSHSSRHICMAEINQVKVSVLWDPSPVDFITPGQPF